MFGIVVHSPSCSYNRQVQRRLSVRMWKTNRQNYTKDRSDFRRHFMFFMYVLVIDLWICVLYLKYLSKALISSSSGRLPSKWFTSIKPIFSWVKVDMLWNKLTFAMPLWETSKRVKREKERDKLKTGERHLSNVFVKLSLKPKTEIRKQEIRKRAYAIIQIHHHPPPLTFQNR